MTTLQRRFLEMALPKQLAELSGSESPALDDESESSGADRITRKPVTKPVQVHPKFRKRLDQLKD